MVARIIGMWSLTRAPGPGRQRRERPCQPQRPCRRQLPCQSQRRCQWEHRYRRKHHSRLGLLQTSTLSLHYLLAGRRWRRRMVARIIGMWSPTQSLGPGRRQRQSRFRCQCRYRYQWSKRCLMLRLRLHHRLRLFTRMRWHQRRMLSPPPVALRPSLTTRRPPPVAHRLMLRSRPRHALKRCSVLGTSPTPAATGGAPSGSSWRRLRSRRRDQSAVSDTCSRRLT